MKIFAALPAALVLLVLAAAPASARGGFEFDCGNQDPAPQGAPYTDLQADNISCRGAHKVASKFVAEPFTGGYKGWVCKSRQVGVEELKVKCSRDNKGGQRLKFFWGA
jgi:hypothetical protein